MPKPARIDVLPLPVGSYAKPRRGAQLFLIGKFDPAGAPLSPGNRFRVDMRLRPLGADGPLACSFDMLETYFVTQGREWERYAWIKGRIVCGDRARQLLEERVRPFVFRRHLDYSAFDSLRELHREVRREVERRDILDNIKLGPGGIREIEFIVQLFQLIRGGRD